jgi:cytochrome P450
MFSTINQSLAFHQSPEAFISRRLQELSVARPEALPPATGGGSIIQASILNRRVHVVSSYRTCRDILSFTDDNTSDSVKISSSMPGGSEAFSIGPAYRELMSDWFPPPNILLEDSQAHAQHKSAWKRQVETLPTDLEPKLRQIVSGFVRSSMVEGTKIDLYETLKTLAWKLLFGAFLNLDSESDESMYSKLERSQEALLRGQFSLFPVSVNTPFWQSARSKGLRSRQELQKLFSKTISQQNPATCPLLRRQEVTKEDIANHCLLFTSSIANKALASLLTASIMNTFLMPGEQSLASLLRVQGRENRAKLLRSVLLETERLSPPVVGVMRRVEVDVVVKGSADEEGHIVPQGHDVWLYFVGASRDEKVFEDAQDFRFDRYMDEASPRGFAFGADRKMCLGSEVVRMMISIVVEEMLKAGVELDGEPQSDGVRAWLGWKSTEDAALLAKDLKQLPCQRPRLPVWVQVSSGSRD